MHIIRLAVATIERIGWSRGIIVTDENEVVPASLKVGQMCPTCHTDECAYIPNPMYSSALHFCADAPRLDNNYILSLSAFMQLPVGSFPGSFNFRKQMDLSELQILSAFLDSCHRFGLP